MSELTIEDLFRKDKECTALYNECTDILQELMGRSEVKKTASTMYVFVHKTSRIKRGIYALALEENLYSINILFRSLIEHFLRFQYISLRHQFDNNDEVGKEYVELLSTSEEYNAGKAWKEISKLANAPENEYSLEVLKMLENHPKNFTDKEIKEVERKFQYKQLIRYIFEKISPNRINNSDQFILRILVEYSKLSSFVHGGPISDVLLDQIANDNKTKSECLRIANLSFTMATTTQFIFLKIYGSYNTKLRVNSEKMAKIIFDN